MGAVRVVDLCLEVEEPGYFGGQSPHHRFRNQPTAIAQAAVTRPMPSLADYD